jgi:hypothetical protein
MFFCDNLNVKVEGTLSVEATAGAISPTDFYYRWRQGAITVSTRANMRQGNKFQALNLFIQGGTVTVGDNATLFNYGGAGLNRTEGAPSRLAIYMRDTSGGSITIGTNSVESTLLGNRTIIRTYTPSSSTDPDLQEGELCSDASWLYRKQGGVIKKVAFVAF